MALSGTFYRTLCARLASDQESGELLKKPSCALCVWREQYEEEHGLFARVEEDFDRHVPLWGRLYDGLEGRVMAANEEECYHVRCLRAFVEVKRKKLRENKLYLDTFVAMQERRRKSQADGANAGDADEDDDELELVVEESAKLYGKKRKRVKQKYQVWVHVMAARDLHLKDKGDKYVDPVAFVSCFGKTVKTRVGDHGRTYECVWDEPFHFQADLDEDEFSRELVKIRIENDRFFSNDLIGFTNFELKTVNEAKDHEFYRQWKPLTKLAKRAKHQTQRAVSVQGKLLVSICCISEKNVKANPRLPVHVYDLDVQMWQDMEQKREVRDYDFASKSWIKTKMADKTEEDRALLSDLWDIISVRVYRGEHMPKVDSRGWCDPYVEFHYNGLLNDDKCLKTKVIKDTETPVWNHEFQFPVKADGDIQFNRIELRLKDANMLQSDVELGKALFNVSDILNNNAINPTVNGPQWVNFYDDRDGYAPRFRGRVLIEFAVQSDQKNPAIGSQICKSIDNHRVPKATTYKLDVEVLEGMHLAGDHKEYEVNVTWGHTLAVPSDHRRGGKAWETFESKKVKRSLFGVSSKKPGESDRRNIVQFLQRQSMLVYGMPSPMQVIEKPTDAEMDLADSPPIDVHKVNASDRGDERKQVDPMSEAEAVVANLEREKARVRKLEWQNRERNREWYRAQMPDIIVYVSRKGSLENGTIGYLRIPMNGRKRATENWENGQDLTPITTLWEDKLNSSATCLPLKDLKERYDAINSFLLLRLNVKQLNDEELKMFNGVNLQREPLPPVERQRYLFRANVFQAKHLASVSSSGLSDPFVAVQLMNTKLVTKHKPTTTFPLWFESQEAYVELPKRLEWAPEITMTVYHHKGDVLFNHPKRFMGRATIAAEFARPEKKNDPVGTPRWHTLEFEELQQGELLTSFELIPAPEDNKPGIGADLVPRGGVSLDDMLQGWDIYAVEIRALALRGLLAKQFAQAGKAVTYEIECWGDVQKFDQQDNDHAANKITVMIRRPADPVFYSSMNVRVYEGDDLKGVTSIPVHELLTEHLGWYKLVDILTREPNFLAAKVVRRWRNFIKFRKERRERKRREAEAEAARLRAEAEALANANGDADDEHKEHLVKSASSSSAASTPNNQVRQPSGRYAFVHDGSKKGDALTASAEQQRERKKNKNKSKGKSKKRKQDLESVPLTSVDAVGSDEVKIDVAEQDELDYVDPAKMTKAEANMLQPREVDENGNEIIEEKLVQKLQCEEVPAVDYDNAYERHWRIDCEYEMLPLTSAPFRTFELVAGKDKVHQSALEKIFVQSKRSVGSLRGSFHAYLFQACDPLTKARADRRKGPAKRESVFDVDLYRQQAPYCVRVYILRALQLLNPKKKRKGDVAAFVTFQVGDEPAQKTYIKDNEDDDDGEDGSVDVVGTLNPSFYQVFDFAQMTFPSQNSSELVVQVWDDGGLFGDDLLGETRIDLESRLFSRQWRGARRPIERRPVFSSKGGMLPQGFVEVCVDIVPMHQSADRPLDFLLNPPRRLPWELRVTLWNTKNVTPKKIYHTDGECCLCEVCKPPDQSDIQLVAGLSGSKEKPQKTDIHYRSVEGEGMFNWRTIHQIRLPAPQLMCNLKVQVWNVNWSPDDCIAEAVIPLAGFFEWARRRYEEEPENPERWVARIPRQYARMTNPYNTDKGDVELSIELLPSKIAKSKAEYLAAPGKDGFDPGKNSRMEMLEPPKRPDTSFPWYRVDKQICFRCKYCWRKIRWYVYGAIFLGLVGISLIIWWKVSTANEAADSN